MRQEAIQENLLHVGDLTSKRARAFSLAMELVAKKRQELNGIKGDRGYGGRTQSERRQPGDGGGGSTPRTQPGYTRETSPSITSSRDGCPSSTSNKK